MFVLFSVHNLLFAQSTYYSYDPNTGTSKEIGYSTQRSNNPSYSPYTSKYDINAYKEAGEYMQKKYDSRVNFIKQTISDFYYDLDQLKDKCPDEAARVKKQLDDIIYDLNHHKYDYGNDNVFSQIDKNFNIIADNINAVIQTYNRKLKSERENNTVSSVTSSVPTSSKVYSGIIEVWGMSHIMDKPQHEGEGAKIIGYAENGRIEILSKYNDLWYYIKYKSIYGYMDRNFFK